MAESENEPAITFRCSEEFRRNVRVAAGMDDKDMSTWIRDELSESFIDLSNAETNRN